MLAGGGARGAYEAGALSVVLPELERVGRRPSLYVGASVGALNAALLASSHHLPAGEQTRRMVDLWRTVRLGDIMRPILTRSGPVDILRFTGQLLGVPGVRLNSLLDPAPLLRSFDDWIDLERLHENVDSGAVDAVAVVTTSARSGRTVVFLDSAAPPRVHRSHAIAYVPTRMEIQHVCASAAIPMLWPAVKIETPERASGWYVDGGTRLNTPIKPALDLGVDRLVVVAVDSIAGPVMEPEQDRPDLPPPDLGDGALHLLEGALVDPLIEDMRTLGDINTYFTNDDPGARLYRTMRGKPDYRRVPYIFVGPANRGAIGGVARRVFDERYGGIRRLRNPDLSLIYELVGGVSESHAELLSLLFFDPAFAEALIDLGRRDARAWFEGEHDAGDEPWQLGALGSFVGPRAWTAG